MCVFAIQVFANIALIVVACSQWPRVYVLCYGTAGGRGVGDSRLEIDTPESNDRASSKTLSDSVILLNFNPLWPN